MTWDASSGKAQHALFLLSAQKTAFTTRLFDRINRINRIEELPGTKIHARLALKGNQTSRAEAQRAQRKIACLLCLCALCASARASPLGAFPCGGKPSSSPLAQRVANLGLPLM